MSHEATADALLSGTQPSADMKSLWPQQYVHLVHTHIKQATKAGEVTRRQQKLQITAEDPPSFLGAPTHDLRLEKAEVKADMRKVCGSNANDVEKENLFKASSF